MTVNGKPMFILTVGLPASGKTKFVAKDCAGRIKSTYIYNNASLIYDNISPNDKYLDIYPNLIKYAKLDMLSDIGFRTYRKQSVLIDSCNVTVESRAEKLSCIYDKKSYHKIAIVFDTPISEINSYMENRKRTADRPISEEIFKDYLNKFSIPSYKEGFDHIIASTDFLKHYFPKKQPRLNEEREEATVERYMAAIRTAGRPITVADIPAQITGRDLTWHDIRNANIPRPIPTTRGVNAANVRNIRQENNENVNAAFNIFDNTRSPINMPVITGNTVTGRRQVNTDWLTGENLDD